jgi:hypothetical protein
MENARGMFVLPIGLYVGSDVLRLFSVLQLFLSFDLPRRHRWSFAINHGLQGSVDNESCTRRQVAGPPARTLSCHYVSSTLPRRTYGSQSVFALVLYVLYVLRLYHAKNVGMLRDFALC